MTLRVEMTRIITVFAILSMVLFSCKNEIILDQPPAEPISINEPDTNHLFMTFDPATRTLPLDIDFTLDLAIDSIHVDYAVGSGLALDPSMLIPFSRLRFDTIRRPCDSVIPGPNTFSYMQPPFIIPGGVDTGNTVWVQFSLFGQSKCFVGDIVRTINTIDRIDTVSVSPTLVLDTVYVTKLDTVRDYSTGIVREYKKQIRIDIVN